MVVLLGPEEWEHVACARGLATAGAADTVARVGEGGALAGHGDEYALYGLVDLVHVRRAIAELLPEVDAHGLGEIPCVLGLVGRGGGGGAGDCGGNFSSLKFFCATVALGDGGEERGRGRAADGQGELRIEETLDGHEIFWRAVVLGIHGLGAILIGVIPNHRG